MDHLFPQENQTSLDADVLLVGAGWTGLQAGAVFQNKFGLRVLIVELKSSIGGTWSEGNAYASLATHSPSATCEFMGFPVPKDLGVDARERISAEKMQLYVQRFVEHANLTDALRLNRRVVSIEHVSDKTVRTTVIFTDPTGAEKEEIYMTSLVMNTGFGTRARPVPNYEGLEAFTATKRETLTAFDIDETKLAELKREDKTVLVLGGSKSAIDILVLLHRHGIKTKWLARRSYWFLNYDVIFGKEKRKKRALLSHMVYRYSQTMGLKVFRKTGVMHNPHPKASDKTAYHFGVCDEKQIATVREIPFLRGEIRKMTSSGIITNKGDEIECDAVVAAFGTDPFPLFPKMYNDRGDEVDLQNVPQLFLGAIHPELPRVFFAGPLFARGITTINGYTSASHAVAYLAMNLSREELQRKAKQEEKFVRSVMGKSFRPFFQRSISGVPNVVKYFVMYDSIFYKNGLASPFNLDVIRFLVRLMNGIVRTPTYRDATQYQLRKAFGPDLVIHPGYGAAPVQDTLAPVALKR